MGAGSSLLRLDGLPCRAGRVDRLSPQVWDLKLRVSDTFRRSKDDMIRRSHRDTFHRTPTCVVATAVSAEGTREILDLDIHTTEDGAGWTAFLRGLVARGLSGVRLVISDAHPGLVDAIASTLPGASWQRCRTHFVRNLLQKVPKAAQPFVASAVRSIFDQPDASTTRAQHARVLDQLEERFPDAAELLAEAGPDILAFSAFPEAHWRQIRSNNPQERLNKEIRRRTDVVGIFPNRAAVTRLVGMVLCEQHDEWAVGRRYMSAESLARARFDVIEGEVLEGVRGELVAAS